MMPSISVIHKLAPKCTPSPATDAFRLRALERLYARKAVVDDLIESLERYQRAQAIGRPDPVEINAGRKCWSDCAQLQI